MTHAPCTGRFSKWIDPSPPARVRIYQRQDGTIITQDCPGRLQLASRWAQAKAVAVASVLTAFMGLTTNWLQGTQDSDTDTHPDMMVGKVTPVIMGEITPITTSNEPDIDVAPEQAEQGSWPSLRPEQDLGQAPPDARHCPATNDRTQAQTAQIQAAQAQAQPIRILKGNKGMNRTTSKKSFVPSNRTRHHVYRLSPLGTTGSRGDGLGVTRSAHQLEIARLGGLSGTRHDSAARKNGRCIEPSKNISTARNGVCITFTSGD